MQFFIHGIDETFSQPLQAGRQIVGRQPDAAIRLCDPSVSKTHAEIILKAGGAVRVQDLNSTNGTFVDNKRVREATAAVGQELRFGNFRTRLDDAPVRVVVPEIEAPKQPDPSWMSDGQPACLLHPGILALYRCARCSQTLCEHCVRRVGLSGQPPQFFCALCSGNCLRLESEKVPKQTIGFKKLLQKLDRFFAAKRQE